MKKFMTIAMIILAAAMLVVSCDANKKADVDHSVLVNATLGVSEGKALVATTNTDDPVIKALAVKITPQWNTLNSEEEPYYGNMTKDQWRVKTSTTDAELTDLSVNLGYISQGLWTVEVEAYSAQTTSTDYLIYSAEGTFFFTQNTPAHTVVLSEDVGDNTATFNFNTITTPAYVDGTQYSLTVYIDGNPYIYTRTSATDDYLTADKTTPTGYDPSIQYFINNGNGAYTSMTDAEALAWFTSASDTTSVVYANTTTPSDWTWTYTSATDELLAGSHSYRVVLENTVSGTTNEGGVAGRFYLAANSTNAGIGGELAKANFQQSSVSFVVDGYKVKYTDDTKAQTTATDADPVTFTVNVTSDTHDAIDEAQITWFIDGVQVMDNTGAHTGYSMTETFHSGYHHVTAKYMNKAWDKMTIKVYPANNGDF